MDIFDTISGRRSIRKFRELPVEPDKISTVLDAARLAPSWKNFQCWRFLVLAEEELRRKVLDAVPDFNPGKKGLAMAPVIVFACADPAESGLENDIPYYAVDVAIAMEHLCLAAHALGLGTCWMGWYDEALLKERFEIPEAMKIVGITPLGYPDQEPKPRPRKELSDIVFFNSWGETAC